MERQSDEVVALVRKLEAERDEYFESQVAWQEKHGELLLRVAELEKALRDEHIETTISGGTICCMCEAIADAGEVLRHTPACILSTPPPTIAGGRDAE